MSCESHELRKNIGLLGHSQSFAGILYNMVALGNGTQKLLSLSEFIRSSLQEGELLNDGLGQMRFLFECGQMVVSKTN